MIFFLLPKVQIVEVIFLLGIINKLIKFKLQKKSHSTTEDSKLEVNIHYLS